MKFSFENTSLISDQQLQTHGEMLTPYIDLLSENIAKNTFDFAEASLCCPFDEKTIQAVEQLKAQKVTDQLAYIVVVGIGGSNLGTKAIYDAIYGCVDQVDQLRMPKMLFFDTNNPSIITKSILFLKENIKHAHEILIISISKSGSTTETLANTEIVIAALRNEIEHIEERIVCITDEGSKFYDEATAQGTACLTIPQIVGGRYAIFSAVGLFPLAALGVDIRALTQSAQVMRDQCLSHDLKQNPALVSAIVLYELYHKGYSIHDTFLFNSELESLGKWYRQLLAESIGKDQLLDGTMQAIGITPTVSVGSVDLHSVVQLNLAGPRDKVTTFVSSKSTDIDIAVPTERMFNMIPMISGMSLHDIMQSILEGTQIAYHKVGMPYMSVVFDTMGVTEIAEFMQFKMLEVMYLGALFGVNPFDQPQVELYKIETKRILETKKI